MDLEVRNWNLHLAFNTYVQEAEFLHPLLNAENKRKTCIGFIFIYTKTSRHTWKLRFPNSSQEQLGADSALLSKTGLRTRFRGVRSWTRAGSDTLQRGQPAGETPPVRDVRASTWARGGKEEQAWKVGSPLIWWGRTLGMVQKVRKTKANSSLDGKDMQLNGKTSGMIHPSLRSSRTYPLELKTWCCRTFLLHTCILSHTKLRATAEASGIQTHSCKVVYIFQTQQPKVFWRKTQSDLNY